MLPLHRDTRRQPRPITELAHHNIGGAMGERILITGGAGFIGSHLADELLRCGYRVRILDNLHSQVHDDTRGGPDYLPSDAELQVADMRDRTAVRQALVGVDGVFHFAARVGVGQSMYRIQDYVSVNTLGTAVLLEELARRPVRRLVVASSMSIYGEGLYRDADGREVHSAARTHAQLERGDWDPRDTEGRPLEPLPTPESKPADLASVYALSKHHQEQMCLIFGRAYDIPTVALRFFNVFGTRQALSNPYTGVLAIFAARLLNGSPPLVFEDGMQQRDFVSVFDVARACRLALEKDAAVGRSLNIGSGRGRTVLEVARALSAALGRPDVTPEIPGRSRMGDIRHCIADISLARELLGFEPVVDFEEGLSELGDWLRGRKAHDRVSLASAELSSRGLTIGGNGVGAPAPGGDGHGPPRVRPAPRGIREAARRGTREDGRPERSS